MGARDLERPQQRSSVVRHRRRRERPVGQGGAPRPAVVKGGEAVAVGEPVELRLPCLGGVAEPGDEKDIRPLPLALDPELGPVGADWLAHLSPSGPNPHVALARCSRRAERGW
jgi:hypothetical protein